MAIIDISGVLSFFDLVSYLKEVYLANNLLLNQTITFLKQLDSCSETLQDVKKADPSRNETVVGEHLKFERKDVWDMKWADVSFTKSIKIVFLMVSLPTGRWYSMFSKKIMHA